ncbi:hypothetical protein LTR56_002351 [Elasticomyces elasticus]|nr:hypothetical protein LTR56_002351 [Elasticomyces elasticus]KAK3665915.1 hypothetical protein LTR22_003234 [Elasticomyces elasticus]KAK4929387.1 hypothetical protein LTR49_003991 [Elasticomyces elasticus]KAK5764676.1 hypothetical protein LTS12_005177 [Elasticomyces elasticus]
MPSTTAAENVTLMHRFITDLQQNGDFTLVDEFFHDDFANHTALPGMPTGREGVHNLLRYLHTALAEIQIEVIHCICEGNVVATTKVLRGRQVGEFFGRGVPESSSGSGRIEMLIMDFMEVVEGRFGGHWASVGPVKDV